MPSNNHRRALGWRMFGSVAAALLLSAATAVAQGAPEPVLVGVNIPRTGPLALMGALLEPSVRLAVDQINTAGGIKSLGGAPLELRWADNQASPSLSGSEEQRLIQQEHVVTVIGGGVSGAELTATQMAERLKVPHLISIATADELSERGFRYTFILSARAVDYARSYVNLLNYLKANRNIAVKRVVVLNENSALGSSVAKDLLPMAKDAGYEIAEQVEYPASTSDVSSLLTRIRSAKPDVVLHIGYIGDSILIWNTRRQLGMEDVPFIGITSGIGSPAFMKAVGAAANGALTLSQTNADLTADAVQNFVRSYQAKYNVPPENNGFFSYQSAYVVKAALEKAGSRDQEAIRQAFSTLQMRDNVVLPQETIRFNEAGVNVDTPVLLLQVRNGQLATVWPDNVATTAPDFSQFDKLRSR
jgi:branched-chain amino acid transport system substrate-binding protein